MKKNNTKKKSRMSVGKMVAIGTGVATLGAGTYYLLGPNAKAHQKKAKVLMTKIKKEVGSEMKKAKNVTVSLYKVVDSISSNYCKQYETHEGEIKAFAKKLKSEWKSVPKLASKKTTKRAIRRLKNKRA